MYIFLLYTFLKSTHEKKCHQDKSFKITIIKNRKHCEMSKAWKAFPAVRGNVFMSVFFCLRLRPFIRWLPPATPGTEGKYQVYYFLQHFSFTNKRHSITRTVHLTVHQPSSHITHTLIQHNTKVACRADMGKQAIIRAVCGLACCCSQVCSIWWWQSSSVCWKIVSSEVVTLSDQELEWVFWFRTIAWVLWLYITYSPWPIRQAQTQKTLSALGSTDFRVWETKKKNSILFIGFHHGLPLWGRTDTVQVNLWLTVSFMNISPSSEMRSGSYFPHSHGYKWHHIKCWDRFLKISKSKSLWRESPLNTKVLEEDDTPKVTMQKNKQTIYFSMC